MNDGEEVTDQDVAVAADAAADDVPADGEVGGDVLEAEKHHHHHSQVHPNLKETLMMDRGGEELYDYHRALLHYH